MEQKQDYASLDDLQRWAATIMDLWPADLRIGDPRALHDHPWKSTSVIIAGRYREIVPGVRGPADTVNTLVYERVAGDIVTRKATDFHRLELVDDQPCISLFFTGPVVREWGFMCPQGWRHHNEFNDPNDIGQVGKGCGE